MKKSLLIITLTALLASCSTSPTTPTIPTDTSTPTVNTETPTTLVPDVTLADLAKHTTQSDCWTAVRGDVYDITSFFGKHPGGDGALMRLCGKDGTEAFTNKHGGQDNPEKALASLPKIGKLQ